MRMFHVTIFQINFSGSGECRVLLKVKLVTVVEGDPKVPFSTATTPRFREGRYSFPWIAPLYA